MNKPDVSNADLLRSAVAGLCGDPKTMESKWLYDHDGSQLFEDITRLPEYYPTRTERGILEAGIDVFQRYLPPAATLVELGSGASVKTRILLDGLKGLAAYLPIDISASFVHASAKELSADYPTLTIEPVVADFMAEIRLPDVFIAKPKAVFFPGSTLGNLDPTEAAGLLTRIRRWDRLEAFIIGIDLVKDQDVLVRAYDDSAGITAAFNLNLLKRLNYELGTDFDLDSFAHEARWNTDRSRIEMHLVSKVAQTVTVGSHEISFAAGESIHTENSRKYTRDTFTKIAASAGLSVAEFLTDVDELFAVAILVVADEETAAHR